MYQVSPDSASPAVELVAASPHPLIALAISSLLIMITLVTLQKLARRFWPDREVGIQPSVFTARDVLIVFGLLILGQVAVSMLLIPSTSQEGDSQPISALLLAALSIVNIAMVALTTSLHRLHCIQKQRSESFLVAKGTRVRQAIAYGILALVCFLPAHFGVAIVWELVLKGLEVDLDTQESVVMIMEAIRDKNWAQLAPLIFFATIVAPISEEVMFRGLLFRVLLDRGGFFMAAIISSALFTLMHDSIASWGPLMVLGMLLAWVYHRSGSLLVSIALHFAFNTAMISLLFIMEGN
jgi:hypothetical protein